MQLIIYLDRLIAAETHIDKSIQYFSQFIY